MSLQLEKVGERDCDVNACNWKHFSSAASKIPECWLGRKLFKMHFHQWIPFGRKLIHQASLQAGFHRNIKVSSCELKCEDAALCFHPTSRVVYWSTSRSSESTSFLNVQDTCGRYIIIIITSPLVLLHPNWAIEWGESRLNFSTHEF